MGAYVTEVRPRWSDMDVYGHVNHASTVTLLEEARVTLLFVEGANHGAEALADGMVVARLVVDYHAPLHANGQPVRVELSVKEVRPASFVMDYFVHNGRSHSDQVAASAETLLVAVNPKTGKPRRLSPAEKSFLAGWSADA